MFSKKNHNEGSNPVGNGEGDLGGVKGKKWPSVLVYTSFIFSQHCYEPYVT